MRSERPLGIIEICQVTSQESNWRGYNIIERTYGPDVISPARGAIGLALEDLTKTIKKTFPVNLIKLENQKTLNKALNRAKKLDNNCGLTFIQEGKFPVTDPRKHAP
jgi:hypothetical protein